MQALLRLPFQCNPLTYDSLSSSFCSVRGEEEKERFCATHSQLNLIPTDVNIHFTTHSTSEQTLSNRMQTMHSGFPGNRSAGNSTGGGDIIN